MAFDPSSLLYQLKPMALDGNFGNIGQLRLMRQQFEETKRRNREDERLRREAEQNELARAHMQAQQAREKAEAERQATLLAKKQEAFQKFTEVAASGNTAAVSAMVPYLSELGMGVDLEGESGGLPRYRLTMDAARDAATESARLAQTTTYGAAETAEQSLSRLGGLGYDTVAGRGNLDDPLPEPALPADAPLTLGPSEAPEFDEATTDALTPGENDFVAPAPEGEVADVAVAPSRLAPSTLPGEDAYAQALAASRFSRLNDGEPVRPPDDPDYMGAVPKNVIDMGAMEAQTLARLNPALKSLVEAYPEDVRPSAASTAAGVKQMSLPLDKAVEEFRSQRGGPDSLISSQIEAGQKRLDKETPDYMERHTLARYGQDEAQQIAHQFGGVKDYVTNSNTYSVADEILSNDDNIDDSMVGELIGRRMGQRGTSTEGDIQRIFGEAAMSFLEMIEKKLFGAAVGGLTDGQRDALKNVLQKWKDEDRKNALGYLDRVESLASDPGTEVNVARGLRQGARLVVPLDVYDEWRSKRKKSEADTGSDTGEPSGAMTPALGAEIEKQANAAGLNGAAVRAWVGAESQGSASAVNQDTRAHGGLLQFAKEGWADIAKAAGTPDVTWEQMLELPADKQIPYVLAYFKTKGLKPTDDGGEYAMATFMPLYRDKPDDFVLGEKDSAEIAFGNVTKGKVWEQNPSLRDGDTITVGGVKRRGREKTSAASAPPTPAKSEAPATQGINRARELLEKAKKP